ncbi:MAG: TetR/AcrR family transcriptional regulator [Acidimicrobiales bacterium]
MTPATAGPDGRDGTDSTEAELRTVLRGATAEVICDRGLGSFSLREVARRAGVSHAAPGYHFGDMEGLLTSLAIEGLATLHREMAAAAAATADPVDRLTAIGLAYVRVGLECPAHMEVVFREDVIDVADQELQHAGLCAFSVLEETITDIAETHDPSLDVRTAAQLCWSAMQGLIQLHPKMIRFDELAGNEPATTEQLVSRFTELILTGLLGVERTSD